VTSGRVTGRRPRSCPGPRLKGNVRTELEDQAIRGVRWTFLGYATSRVLGLVATFVLARLLVPHDFGVIALASAVLELAHYLTALGLGPALVVRQDLRGDDLGTALSLLLVTNVVTAVAVACLAPVGGIVLRADEVVPVLLVMASPLLIGGLSSFYESILQRELRFRTLFVGRGVQTVLSVLVSVVLAVAGAGVWSLVVGSVVGDVVYPFVLVALAPYRVRPAWNPDVARSLMRSGRGFILQSVLSFVEQNADYAVVGRTLGAQRLGVYSMGFRMGEIPYNSIVQPVAQATFPGFARLRERGEDPSGSFLAVLRLTSMCALPIGMVMAGAARPLVATLLGPKWESLAGLLPILAVWGSVRAISGTVGWFVSSVGLAARIGAAYAGLVTVSLPVLILAVRHLGIRGAALTMTANVVVSLGVGARICSRRLGIAWRRQWAAVRLAVVAAVPTALAASAVSAGLRHAPAALSLAAATVVSGAVYVVVISYQDPAAIPRAARQIGRIVGRASPVDGPPSPAPAGDPPHGEALAGA
jgi:O-antigen/teichoic acid export membrane protein